MAKDDDKAEERRVPCSWQDIGTRWMEGCMVHTTIQAVWRGIVIASNNKSSLHCSPPTASPSKKETMLASVQS